MGKHSNKKGFLGIGGHKGRPIPAGRGRAGGLSGRQARPLKDQYELSDASKRRKGALEAAPARLKAERERRKGRIKRGLLIAGGVLLLTMVIAAVGVFAYLQNLQSTMRVAQGDIAKVEAELKKAEPLEPYTVLLLGTDRRPDEERYRTDTMILAKVDPREKKVWLLSIPRDTRVRIPGHGTAKINQAFFNGGPELAIKTVREFTGVPINHYMEVNFRGFEKVVDAMGGVWIDVPYAIDDWKAASHSPGKRARRIDAGYQLLDGEHALTFVRTRDFIDADFTRMQNQQLFFKALADQVANRTNVAKLPKVVSSVAPYISSDMTLMEMVRTTQALRDAGSDNVYAATVEGEWRSPYVHPDMDNLATLIERMNAGLDFEESEAEADGEGSTGATNDAADAQPVSDEPVEPSRIKVAVRNGSGIAGVAKQAASIIRTRGFNVPEVGNANQAVYDKTLVVYKSNRAAAEAVAAGLPPGTRIVESRGMYAFDTDVLVVVGKDWDVRKVPIAPIETR